MGGSEKLMGLQFLLPLNFKKKQKQTVIEL